MRLAFLPPLLLSILCFSLLQRSILGAKKSYIVYLGAHSHANDPTSIDLDRVTDSHYNLLGSYLGSSEKAREVITYSYTRHINGFAAVLEEEEAAEIAKHPDVVSVFPNKARKLQTTRSWDFVGLERNGVIRKSWIWKKARFGEDTIIGNLDTGVWPESKSFSDQGLGPIPSKWRGICQKGHYEPVRCNRKLIGVRYFYKGYASFGNTVNSTFNTARDYNGHGSHTLSTAGGNFVTGASVLGNGNGTAKGGSPRARLAAYKVCWPPVEGELCVEADILAAFDAAISDGVDVLSVSLGGDAMEFFQDGIAIGAFHAVQKGIVVVAAGGNSGPGPKTVQNVAPWIVTVGATTIDRDFSSYVALGNKRRFKGSSLSSSTLPSQKFYPLISAADAKAAKATTFQALLCEAGTLDPKKVRGKILVCLRGDNDRVDKGVQARIAGAVGMILVNDVETGNEIIADAHLLPASHITYSDGQALFDYIKSTKAPVAYLTPVKTELGIKPAPVVTGFSSRGPNVIQAAILKPDITAPGVNIIAAYTEAVGSSYDKRHFPYNAESGTSMSCPHVAGIAGLLRTLHPDWSPAAILSAIITTARVKDNTGKPITTSSRDRATPFDYGAGHVFPDHAMDPGLVYDLTADDYLNFLCAHGYNQTQLAAFARRPYNCPKSFRLENFNYPSITVPQLRGSVTITRRLKNVGSPGNYSVRVTAPKGVIVSVRPKTLKFSKLGEEKTFKLVLKPKVEGQPSDYAFGRLIWSDGKHHVRSPLVARYS